MDHNLKNTFLALIRSGIGHPLLDRLNEIDWKAVEALAARQGLSAIVVDGVERLPENHRPPKLQLLQWIGEVLQNYEQRYELYRRAILEMAEWHSVHGYKMMVLKGYACGVNWPKPEHRPYGDIDIWQFGKQQEIDALMIKEKGIIIDSSHHHHTVYEWRGFAVENHYDFVNTTVEKSSRELEKIFKELGKDDSCFVDLYGKKVFIPHPNLHALFLIRHMVSHFAGACITLRQVLDWAFFVQKHTKDIDWAWLNALIDKYHMKDFYNCINAICVEDLGFPVENFYSVQFDPQLKERILNDIISPSFPTESPSGMIPRVIYKLRRWNGNAWKRKLCYKENKSSLFITGLWSHIMKPQSI